MLYYGTESNRNSRKFFAQIKTVSDQAGLHKPNSYHKKTLEGVKGKNLQATIIFVDFYKAFDSVHREKLLRAYGIPAETLEAIMMLYNDTKLNHW